MVEYLLATAEGWMLSALLGGVTAFPQGSVLTDESMEMYHHFPIFQSLNLSLAPLELLNLLLQLLNTYRRR